jgi:hypothetical protein
MKREFSITPKYFAALVREHTRCAVTGVAFEFEGKRNPFRPSLDRIDSSRGYEPGNVRLVTLAANLAMSNWGDETLLKMGLIGVPQQGGRLSEASRD